RDHDRQAREKFRLARRSTAIRGREKYRLAGSTAICGLGKDRSARSTAKTSRPRSLPYALVIAFVCVRLVYPKRQPSNCSSVNHGVNSFWGGVSSVTKHRPIKSLLLHVVVTYAAFVIEQSVVPCRRGFAGLRTQVCVWHFLYTRTLFFCYT
ncbi:unnamed protein product, partial [Laminaria digitata]